MFVCAQEKMLLNCSSNSFEWKTGRFHIQHLILNRKNDAIFSDIHHAAMFHTTSGAREKTRHSSQPNCVCV